MNTFRSMGLGTGIILAIIGIVLFAYPVSSMWVLAVVAGCGILIMGINAIITWYRGMRGTGAGGGILLMGILTVIFGVLCLISPLAFAEFISWLVTIAIIVFGIAQIVSIATTPSMQGKAIGIIGSIIVVIFGVLAFFWPPLLMQFIGISLIIEGITVIVMALMYPRE